MRLLATLILIACLTGCRIAVIPMPSGKTCYVGSFVTDPHFNRVELRADGSVVLDGYGSNVNTQATAAVVEGAVRAFIKP